VHSIPTCADGGDALVRERGVIEVEVAQLALLLEACCQRACDFCCHGVVADVQLDERLACR
jgi:hypothetical protein